MSHLLLVDDDTDMLAMTGRWLEKAGYEVSKAASGKEALGMLKSAGIDLVLLDYKMPVMDGPAVLKAIRSDDATKSIPVLYRTGADDTEYENDDVKPDGIVPKSDGKPGLMKAVEAALA